jgi:UDP-N-acetylmuramyl pentapeptide phosphotransferase/UDP-N-acetylglucosamine-1-phosphate transferase
MIEAIYQLGLFSSLIFLGAIWLTIVLAQLTSNAYNWVNDVKCKPITDSIPFMGDPPALIIGGVIIVIIVGVVWPLAYPCFLIFGILYTIRKFRRFQKRVESAFSGKANKKHTHVQSDING